MPQNNKTSKTKKTKTYRGKRGPVNGDEPPINLDAWNSRDEVKDIHNCYAYFLNYINEINVSKCSKLVREKRIKEAHKYYNQLIENYENPKLVKDRVFNICKYMKPQPGYTSGLETINDANRKNIYKCDRMVSRVLSDSSGVYKASSNQERCKNGYYKGALVISPKTPIYHFYRQNPDGTWSHKDGSFPATLFDASGRKILDPKYANKNYGYDRRYIDKNGYPKKLNYTDFCSYFCVSTDKTKLLDSKSKL